MEKNFEKMGLEYLSGDKTLEEMTEKRENIINKQEGRGVDLEKFKSIYEIVQKFQETTEIIDYGDKKHCKHNVTGEVNGHAISFSYERQIDEKGVEFNGSYKYKLAIDGKELDIKESDIFWHKFVTTYFYAKNEEKQLKEVEQNNNINEVLFI